MTDSLAELQRLATEATPGPWERTTKAFDDKFGIYGHSGYRIASVHNFNGSGINAKNAAYIAACSPERILRLVRIAQAAERVDALVIPPIVEPAFAALREALGEKP